MSQNEAVVPLQTRPGAGAAIDGATAAGLLDGSRSATSAEQRQWADQLLARVMQLAEATQAVAAAAIGKVRTAAIVAAAAAAWLAFAAFDTFGLGVVSTMLIMLPLSAPTVVLLKIHGMLQRALGLPGRVLAVADEIRGRAIDMHDEIRAGTTVAAIKKPRLTDLLRLAKAYRIVRKLAADGSDLAAAFGGSLVIANPVFGIVTLAATIATVLLSVLAGVVGLAYIV